MYAYRPLPSLSRPPCRHNMLARACERKRAFFERVRSMHVVEALNLRGCIRCRYRAAGCFFCRQACHVWSTMHAYYACVACMRICHVCIQAAPQPEQTTAQARQTEINNFFNFANMVMQYTRDEINNFDWPAFFEHVRASEQQGHFARVMRQDRPHMRSMHAYYACVLCMRSMHAHMSCMHAGRSPDRADHRAGKAD